MSWRFSPKQREVLCWWREPGWEAVICDGAVRSGKTFSMGLSFFLWATIRFSGQRFALCGRSAGAVRRNLLDQVGQALRGLGFSYTEQVSRGTVTVGLGSRRNTFYLFGGMDEASAAAIQGVTLAGVLLDEVALMPRSFVEQACARCSVEGSRLWFNCNPEGPGHWFYREWICQREEKRAKYLHFTMEDNPALSPEMRARFARRFQGTFYRRFILGEWTAAQGLVYGFFRPDMVRAAPGEGFGRWAVSCDYGTVNPASFGLWGERDGVWFRVEEFYYDARREGRQRTDGEYAQDLRRLVDGRRVEFVVADPSAASFIELLRREGWPVRKAENDVLAGIRVTAELLRTGRLVICETCGDCLRELGLYRWDERGERDRVRKEHDHAMDDMRYFAMEISRAGGGGWAAAGVERAAF